jgi:hypothetical protein
LVTDSLVNKCLVLRVLGTMVDRFLIAFPDGRTGSGLSSLPGIAEIARKRRRRIILATSSGEGIYFNDALAEQARSSASLIVALNLKLFRRTGGAGRGKGLP